MASRKRTTPKQKPVGGRYTRDKSTFVNQVSVNEGPSKAPEFTVVKNRHNQFVLHYGKRFIGRFATEEDANSVAEGIASGAQNG